MHMFVLITVFAAITSMTMVCMVIHAMSVTAPTIWTDPFILGNVSTPSKSSQYVGISSGTQRSSNVLMWVDNREDAIQWRIECVPNRCKLVVHKQPKILAPATHGNARLVPRYAATNVPHVMQLADGSIVLWTQDTPLQYAPTGSMQHVTGAWLIANHTTQSFEWSPWHSHIDIPAHAMFQPEFIA